MENVGGPAKGGDLGEVVGVDGVAALPIGHLPEELSMEHDPSAPPGIVAAPRG